MLAPGGAKSTSTDAKLLQRIDDFIERQCALGRASYSVLVLITGDDDYTPRVKRAMHAGMDVELLHPAGITSRSLMATLEGRANVWHAEWQQFLEYWINASSSNSGSAGPSGGGQASSRQPQQGGPRTSESASGGGTPAAAAGGNKGTQPPPPPQQRTPQQQQQQAPPPAAAASSRGSDDSRSNNGTTSNKERASAVLALSSLPVVRQSCDPDRALAAVCGWLASERRDNSAFYQSLHAFASECGCKLVVDRDLLAAAAEGGGGGELTLMCVDDDERHPQRAVQSARDRLRNEINEVLLDDPDVLLLAVAMRQQQQRQQQQRQRQQQSPRQQPQPQQPSQPQQAQQQAAAQRALRLAPETELRKLEPEPAAALLRVEDAGVLLRQRGFCAAAAPPGWVWPASEEQLRAAAKAVVLVELGLGVAPLPLPNGRALTARPFDRAAPRFPEFELAAVAAMLRSRFHPSQLETVWKWPDIRDAAASFGPGWISGGGGDHSSHPYDQMVRGLTAALWLRHCDGAGLYTPPLPPPPPQQAPQPPAAAAAASTVATSTPTAAADAAASSVAAPNASAAAVASSTDGSSSTPAAAAPPRCRQM